jgi:hypothetical protein
LNSKESSESSTFTQEILGDTSWVQNLSEKEEMLKALNNFVIENNELHETRSLQVSGGAEIGLKSPEDQGLSMIPLSSDGLFSFLGDDYQQLIKKLENKRPQNIDVIFITEKFRPWSEVSTDLKEGFINELVAAFPTNVAELFEKMIQAMELSPSQVMLLPAKNDNNSDHLQLILNIAAFYQPQLIVTLGSTATQVMLKSNDRLSLIHGQFFSKKVTPDYTSQIVPLFHPEILHTNVNMKKTAWADMKKMMHFLKKNPANE